jgi:hypothetical protein
MLPADQIKRGWLQIAAGLMFSAKYFLSIPYTISHEALRDFEIQQPVNIGDIQRSRGGLPSGQFSRERQSFNRGKNFVISALCHTTRLRLVT